MSVFLLVLSASLINRIGTKSRPQPLIKIQQNKIKKFIRFYLLIQFDPIFKVRVNMNLSLRYLIIIVYISHYLMRVNLSIKINYISNIDQSGIASCLIFKRVMYI